MRWQARSKLVPPFATGWIPTSSSTPAPTFSPSAAWTKPSGAATRIWPPAPTLPAGAEQAAKVIDRASLAGPVRFLADDLLEGRAPSHRGDALACLYVASEMESLGLQPGGPDGGWEQRFALVGITTKAPETWTFRAGGHDVALRFWEDFIAASGVQAPAAAIADAEAIAAIYNDAVLTSTATFETVPRTDQQQLECGG